ncbi:RagB/SusD family nutrient uptake outer membrane protein [Sphingobacterium chungjuense]|uniref:RagB/SusD family nutrient uptake outer membrane protein n=1 Tax=Sphingobacterium chungjuense TaxID=2675553 RepID=UPI00140CA85D|nr:RagB/SusD family nutrient uptake outer membrane protein [Sphingobacterium chungjuense]
MKFNIFKTICAVGIVAFLTSCDSKLELLPRDAVSPELVGGPEGEKLLNGIYDAFQNGNLGSGYAYLSYVTEDLSADNLKYRATFFQHGEIDNNAILLENVLVSRYFNFPYVAIQRANDLIEIVNNAAGIDEASKTKLLGTAYFFRAYGYYRLVTIFGAVPIVPNRDIIELPRNSVDEVYAQIISDLEASIANPAPFSNSNYVSVEAAKALLARVYLIRGDKASAKRYALEVINSGKFAIESNYASMFTTPFTSNEHIFKIANTAVEGANALDFFLQHPDMPGGGRAELPVDESLIAAYESGDTRKAASVTQIVAPAANPGWYSKKYQDPSGNGAHPYYILRLAEMYLIAAEADVETAPATALTNVNIVRTNRGLNALTSVTLQDIIKERRVEFAFENLRWMDMRRTASVANPAKSMATVFLEAKGRSVNDELYPIPQSAINTNPLLLPNNPGYN